MCYLQNIDTHELFTIEFSEAVSNSGWEKKDKHFVSIFG